MDPAVDELPRPVRQEQELASDEVTEAAPGILRLQLPIALPGLGHVNTYAIEDGDGFALVDPGLPGAPSWRMLLDRMERAGIPMRRVHHVVVTHSHPDHFGGAGMLAQESGADIVASSWFRTWFDNTEEAGEPKLDLRRDDEDEDEFLKRFEHPTPWGGDAGKVKASERATVLARREEFRTSFVPPRPSISLDDADRIHLGGREWLGVHTPGHTSDHLCLYDPENGVLLSGDHVLPTITPHISGLIEGDPLRAYLESLDKVAAFPDVSIVLPAHGHPFDALQPRVEAIKAHHQERLDLLQAASQRLGWANVTQLMHELFSTRSWGHMAESETFAHLEHLRMSGQAQRREEGGYFLYLIS